MTLRIPFVGGPLDGLEEDFFCIPAEWASYNYGSHSYEFDYVEWQYTYKGVWQSVDAFGRVVLFRSFKELAFELGCLMGRGDIDAAQSLSIQREVVSRNSLAFLKYEHNDGRPLF